jgi:antitoxin (DNA-binding transcriptional repressor) of toxin-antitoxin stability system
VKRYTAAAARQRLAEALDDADRGVPVVIERKGVRYRLALEKPVARRRAGRLPHVEILDPAVAKGAWTWDWTPKGLVFRSRRRG